MRQGVQFEAWAGARIVLRVRVQRVACKGAAELQGVGEDRHLWEKRARSVDFGRVLRASCSSLARDLWSAASVGLDLATMQRSRAPSTREARTMHAQVPHSRPALTHACATLGPSFEGACSSGGMICTSPSYQLLCAWKACSQTCLKLVSNLCQT